MICKAIMKRKDKDETNTYTTDGKSSFIKENVSVRKN